MFGTVWQRGMVKAPKVIKKMGKIHYRGKYLQMTKQNSK